MSQSTVIVCDLSVFTDAERKQHMLAAEELFKKVTVISKDDEGYILQFPDTSGIILEITQFIENERRCCPFIHYVLDVQAYSNCFNLHLNGNADVQDVIIGALFPLLPATVKLA